MWLAAPAQGLLLHCFLFFWGGGCSAGMEGSSLGVWVAHGEGRVEFANAAVEEFVLVSCRAEGRRGEASSTCRSLIAA